MGDKSGIEWTDATWGPVTGCTKVSAGCKHCYAERQWPRLAANPKTVYHGRKFKDVMCHEDRLDQPRRWTKPRMVFVNSVSDLFHEQVPDDFIARVFTEMRLCPQHTFQILTKRPERMWEWFRIFESGHSYAFKEWPLSNVWVGVSVEDQVTANDRLPFLFETPAAVRFVSCEPLLGPIDLLEYGYLQNHEWAMGVPGGLNWVIAGGESGPRARPSHPDWFLALRDQCVWAGVPFFMKQMASKAPIPDDLMIREYPNAKRQARQPYPGMS